MTKKVLHIAETAIGGISTYLNTLIPRETRYVTSVVIVPEDHARFLAPTIELRKFKYGMRSIASLLRLISVARNECCNFQPDIVYCHSSFTLIPLILLKTLFPRVKFIYCAHGWAGQRETRNPLLTWTIRIIEGALCGAADKVVCISKSDYLFAMKQAYRGRFILIENALDDHHMSRTDPEISLDETETINLLFVGRLDRQKGIDVLLEAFRLARQSNPALRLTVVGASVVSAEAIKPELKNGVTFEGWLDAETVNRYYRAADILIVPSRWEGFGLVVIEAYRSGTPVLVSDRGALPDLVVEGITGVVSELSVDALASELRKLKKSDLRKKRTACLDLFKARFHADRLERQILDVYQELTAVEG